MSVTEAIKAVELIRDKLYIKSNNEKNERLSDEYFLIYRLMKNTVNEIRKIEEDFEKTANVRFSHNRESEQ